MSSDRTQFKQVVAGSIGDSRTLATPPLQANGCVAQDSQRYKDLCLVSGTAANTTANYSMFRTDRPVRIQEVRILPSAAVTVSGNTVFKYGYTNDGGGAFTLLGTINTNQNASLGTGNLAQWVSVVIPPVAGANQVVPSGSHFVMQQIGTAPSEALPAGTTFQVIWEEV